MTTDIARLGARLRIGWWSLLVAAGCDAPAADKGTEAKVEVKAEAKSAAKVEPPIGDAKAVVPIVDEKAVVPPGDMKTGEPPVADTQETKAGETKAGETKAGETKKVVADRPEERPPDGRGKCPSGEWTGPATLAKKLTEGANSTAGCPRFIHRDDQKLDDADTKALLGLPSRASGTLDVTATKKAGAGNCTYDWVVRCPGGRVLIEGGGPVLAEPQAGAAWGGAPAESGADEAVRAALAAGWLLDARTEHASIASFARATLELLALGAPPALVAGCQQAGLEEVEHARVCFALASRYAGRALDPGPLPAVTPRAADLVRLACDTFVEGCVGETIAALAAVRAQRGCEDEAVAAALGRIAEDETRHAALAWATLRWAAERGGAAVTEAVRALATAMQRAVSATEPPAREGPALARHGRLDAVALHACAVDAWRALIPEALAELLGGEAWSTGDGARA